MLPRDLGPLILYTCPIRVTALDGPFFFLLKIHYVSISFSRTKKCQKNSKNTQSYSVITIDVKITMLLIIMIRGGQIDVPYILNCLSIWIQKTSLKKWRPFERSTLKSRQFRVGPKRSADCGFY